jgi:SAM-dependent methyltransferase
LFQIDFTKTSFTAAEMDEAEQFRSKPTDIENVLAPISTWPKENLRRFRYVDLDGQRATLEPSEFAHLDPHPLPKPIDREGYATEENSDRYWISGLSDWRNVSSAIKRHLPATEKIRLLDFGCASGRVLRHALTQPGEAIEIHGCDLAPANIQWIKLHLPDAIQCEVNSAEPKLPFDDNFFNVVTAFSVFTHIDEQEIDWLLELKRIVQPGGILYLTIHNDATWIKAKDRSATIKQFEHQNKFDDNLKVDAEMLEGPMPKDRIVFRKDHEAVYNCNVWHSDKYIRREWGSHFEILEIADNAHASFQTPVIMRG